MSRILKIVIISALSSFFVLLLIFDEKNRKEERKKILDECKVIDKKIKETFNKKSFFCSFQKYEIIKILFLLLLIIFFIVCLILIDKKTPEEEKRISKNLKKIKEDIIKNSKILRNIDGIKQ